MTASDALRLSCGIFFIPHTVLKFVFFNDTVAFFHRAGYAWPRGWICIDATVEIFTAAMLLSNTNTRIAGSLAALLLTIAAISIWRANGRKWRWNRGGPEYPIFWAIMCLIVAWGFH